MSFPNRPIVLIPARLKATRLPDKPLADINGAPMIVHVWRRAREADLGPVLVAAGEGYRIICDSPTLGSVREVSGKYEVVSSTINDPCLPDGVTRYVLEVTSDGDERTVELTIRLDEQKEAVR